MKKSQTLLPLLIVAGSVCLTSLVSCKCKMPVVKAPVVSGKPDSTSLNDMVAALKLQVEKANSQFTKDFSDYKLILNTVSVSLQTSSTNTFSGSATVLIFKPAYVNKKSRSINISFNLDNVKLAALHNLAKPNKHFELAAAIYNSAAEFSRLPTEPINGLSKKTFDIDVIYTVESDVTGELIFTIIGVGADASYESDGAVQQEIKLNYSVDKS